MHQGHRRRCAAAVVGALHCRVSRPARDSFTRLHPVAAGQGHWSRQRPLQHGRRLAVMGFPEVLPGPFQPPLRRWLQALCGWSQSASRVVTEPLAQCRGAWSSHRQDSGAAVLHHLLQSLSQPGAWAASALAFHSLFFYTPDWGACESSPGQALLARGPARAPKQLPQCALQRCINGIGTAGSMSQIERPQRGWVAAVS